MAAKSGKRGALRNVARQRATSKPASPKPAASRPSASSVRRSTPARTSRTTDRARSTTTSRPTARRSTPAVTSSAPPRPAASSRGTSPLRRRAQETQPQPAVRSSGGAVRGGTFGRARRATIPGAVGTSAGTHVDDLRMQVQQLRSRFSQLQAQAQLGDLYQQIGRYDARVNELPRELEALRSRGYIHAGLIDDDIADVVRQWESSRYSVQAALDQQTSRMSQALAQAAAYVNQLSAGDVASLSAADSALAALQNQIYAARNSVGGLFGGIEQPLSFLEQTIQRFDWVLEQFQSSPNIRLMDAEAPLMATEAEWERDGEEGPDGTLYLTDQRLLFEQNEEIATEKLFGLITTKKETRRELLLDMPIHQIEQVGQAQQGGFLGLGRTEKLQLILSAQAQVGRANFELKGQAASDWVIWIKRVQSGEIDRDRAAGFAEEVRAAEERAARFPAQCPNCFGPLPPPARGETYVVCEYCGSVIHPAEEPPAG